jgi:hypothetical protein
MNFGNSQVLIKLVVSAAVLGGAIGAGIGVVAALLGKQGRLDRAFLIDTLLGSLGFVVSRIVFALLPIHGTTVTYHVGNAVVTSTMNRYQYPNRVAFPVAVLLPLLYEFFLLKKGRSAVSR